MIKSFIEQAIANIEREKASAVGAIENRVIQSKVVQYNVEMDKKRDEEVNELTVAYNKAIQELQAKFVDEKNSIVAKYESDKKAFKDNAVYTETSATAYEYDKNIAKLKEMIKE